MPPAASQNPRYEVKEGPPLPATIGYGLQFSLIASATLASVVFGLLDEASEVEPVAAPLTAFATLVVVAALTLRGSAVLRL